MRRWHPVVSGIGALLLWLCVSAAHADDASGVTDSQWRESVLALRLNGADTGETVVALRDAAGGLWLPEQLFTRLRLRVPRVQPHLALGERYFPLAAVRGSHVSFDEAHSEVSVTAPAAAFESSTVTFAGASRPAMSRSGTGAFLNYVLYGQTGQYSGADVGSAYSELGIFSPVGVLTSTGVATATSSDHGFVRLETTLSHDFPASLQTLRLGDAISVPGSWSQAVRFGGLQWGTNYGIRPDLVTTPLLAATGTAVVPSTVDVFVNGRAVGSTEVPAGPFVVNQVPALTGGGDVRIVVRNALGQVQVVSVPFYSSAVLLQPGLSLYDIDIGAVRNNFGISSNDYGPLLASGTWRHGFTSALTAEVHGEGIREGPHAAGLDVAAAVDHWAVVTADVAVGGAPASFAQPATSGSYGAFGIERAVERLSLLLRTEYASPGFRDVGDLGLLPPPRERNIAQAGWSMRGAGNLALAFVRQKNFDDTHQQAIGLTYQVKAGPGSFNANLSHMTGDTRDDSVYLLYTLPLGGDRSLTTTARYDSQQPAPSAALVETLQKNVPAGVGNGYLLSAGTDGSYDAGYTHQADTFTFDAGAARYAGQSAERLSVSGGAIFMDGELRAARTVRDSFALVDVGGVPNMTVYFDNQPVARTDDNGVAIVRDLRSYDVNRLSIDAQQLPLDAAIGDTQLRIVPPFRSGTLVHFPVKRVHSGVFHLRQADGRAVPAGAVVRFQGEEFPVGLDGLTYLTNYDHGTGGEAHWNGGQCRFRLPPPPAGQTQPDVGDITCRSVQ
jgi:outer membrane usher protein